DGGERWEKVKTPSGSLAVLAIDPRTPTTLYAGGHGTEAIREENVIRYADVVFRSTDAATSWEVSSPGGLPPSISGLAVGPSGTVYAGSDGQGVFRSTDGGATWAALNAGLVNRYVSALAVDPADPARVFAGTNGGGIFVIRGP